MRVDVTGGTRRFVVWRRMAVGALASAVTAFAASAPAQTLNATGTGANAPFHFLDAATNTQRGISVDIINAVATDLGLTVIWGPQTPVAELAAAINSRTFDIYAGAISITPARLQEVAMTIPWYIGTGEGLWVPKTDNTDYRSLQDFAGHSIGAVRGSSYATALESMPGVFREVRLYDNPAALARGIIEGQVDGGIINGTTAEYTIFQGNYPELQVPPAYVGTIAPGVFYGTPLPMEASELVDQFNDSIAKLMVNGTIRAIFADYGLEWPAPQAR